MSDFKKALHQYKTSLAFSLFNGGEKSRVSKILDDIDRHEHLAQSMFEAGQQSMQAKINELQRKIAFQEKAIKNIKLQFENKQIDCDRSDRKIDELQKKLDCCREENKAHLEKIDEALTYLRHTDFRECKESMLFNILKGNKDD